MSPPDTPPGTVAPRPLCGAKTRSGGRCCRVAGWGTEHLHFGRCRLHGGATPDGKRFAAAAMARAHVASLVGPVELEAHEALELARSLTLAEVRYFGERIAELGEGEVAGQATVTTRRRGEAGGEGEGGEGGEGGYVTEERQLAPALHVLIRARSDALERLARFAKMSMDARTDERRTALVEGAAAQLEPVLRGILDALGLTADQRARAPAILVEHLAQLEPPPANGHQGAS